MKKLLLILSLLLFGYPANSQSPALFSNLSPKWIAKGFAQKVFIENKDQFGEQKIPAGTKYFVDDDGVKIWFTPTGLRYSLEKYEYTGDDSELKEEEEEEENNPAEELRREMKIRAKRARKIKTTSSVIDITWVNANPDVQLVGVEAVEEYYTYCDTKSPDMKHPRTITAHACRKLLYKNLYPQIDVEYTFHPEEGIKYVLLLHPGADISKVQMKYDGTKKVFEDAFGNIHVETKFGDIIDHAPQTYYAQGGMPITSAFRVKDKTVSFQLDAANFSREIVIDPWSVAPAMGADNKVLDIQHDAAGNLYVYGSQNPYKVRKYNSAGVVQWTYNTGNSSGAGDIATDPSGYTYCTYDTYTILKLDPNGNLVFTATTTSLEQWRLSFNNTYTTLVVAGAFMNGANNNLAYVDLNTGALLNQQDVGGDLRSLTYDQNGNYYALLASVTPVTSLVGISPGLTQLWSVLTLYTANYNPGPNYTNSFPTWPVSGQNAVATYCNYVYLFNGATLYKYNIINGGLIGAPVAVPGGAYENNSGIAIDNCGNIYVGSQTGVYKYNPSLQQTASSAPVLGAIYDITINTNGDVVACGNNVITALNLTACAPLTLSVTATGTPCSSNPATATAIVSGGSPPYTYVWSDGQVTSAATGLSSGSYTVIVSDGSNCITQTAVVNINVSPGISSVPVSSTNVICSGQNNGTASVSPQGGTMPFTYQWSNGQTIAALTGLSAGTYSVLVTDSSGCTATASAVITQPAAITITTTITQASCGSNTGGATASASGGGGTFSYAWFPGGQTTSSISGLMAGLYTVTVTDQNGCSKNKVISISNSNGPNATMSQTNIICNGQCTGTASAAVAGGSQPYTFTWSGGQSTSAVSGLCAGNYTVTVTDNSGCKDINVITITQPQVISASMNVTHANCGQSNGSISASASGGTSPYMYVWNNGQSGSNATGLSVGTYTVDITDASGCSSVQSASVSNLTGPNATMSQVNVLCYGQCNGAASVTASGGGSPYTYAWSNGQTTSAANNLCAGTYTLSLTDATGCVSISSVNITQPTAALTISTTSTPASCGLNDGTVTANVSGGTPVYTYQWSNGKTTSTVTGLGVGSYTVTIIDGNGCLQLQSVSVTSLNGPVTTMSQTNILCNGQCTGTATAAVTGGNFPYSYSWTGGQTTSAAVNLCAGNYTVVVKDASGCTDIQVVSITQPLSPLVINNTVTNASCGQNDGTINASASGGTPSYSYSWSNGQQGANATGLGVGLYTVTVTDGNGCVQTSVTQVNNNSGPVITSFSSANPSCFGNANGSAGVVVTGSGLTYSWTPNVASGASASGLSAGTYTVIVSDANGCSAIQLFNLTQPAALTSSVSSTTALCGNNGSATVSASGGTGPFTYQWTPGGQVGSTASGLGAGTYSVTVMDVNGCSAMNNVTVNGVAGPTATAGSDVTIITGADTILSATGGGTYSWSPSDGLSCTNCPNPVASPTATTQYCVTVTDTNGCTDSDCIKVVVEFPCPDNITIDLPNAFSPNDDGHNDVFRIAGLEHCVSKYTLSIYNRWGAKIYETNDLAQSWDGIYKGKKLDPAVFVYYFSALFTNGQSYSQKGNISLLR